MMNTVLRKLTAFCIALLCAGAVQAGDWEDAVSAYDRKDYATALEKFRIRAQQGSASAQFSIGLMYDEGQGVAQDYKEAVRWYKLAAQQGRVSAQHNLGVMYANGTGVLQDNTRAHLWFNLAAVGGDKKSVDNRDVMASKMTAQHIELAQRMARECMNSNFKKCE